MKSIAILGNGIVGSGVHQLIHENNHPIQVSKILVKDILKHEKCPHFHLITDDFDEILTENIDIIVELIGGTDPAYDYVKQALENNIHVVTANKDLIAKHGEELLNIAKEHNVKLYFEGSVGGGIPIIKPIYPYIQSNNISSIGAILNGTTNFILTQMDQEKISYDEALKLAQDLGFAESDPSSDVKGYDSARKLSILSTLCYHTQVDWEHMSIEGITHITEDDMKRAQKMNKTIKLLGMSKPINDKIYACIRPVLVPIDSSFGRVHNEYNSIVVQGNHVGKLTFSGKGAGKLPTATAVYSDILDILYLHPAQFSFNSKRAIMENYLDEKMDWYLSIRCSHSSGIINHLFEAFSNIDVKIYPHETYKEVTVIIEDIYEENLQHYLQSLSSKPDIHSTKHMMIINDL